MARKQAAGPRDDLAEMLANLGVSEELIRSVEVVTAEPATAEDDTAVHETAPADDGFDLREWTEDPPEPAPTVVPGASHAADWLRMLDTLRTDIERLRSEQLQKTATARATEDNVQRLRRDLERELRGPVQDEWGFFDPERAGLEAVQEKLDEIFGRSE